MVIIDTNVLLEYPKVIDEFDEIGMPCQILEELDVLKRDREKGYYAREAHRKIKENIGKIKFIGIDNYEMPEGWERVKNDNKIIMAAKAAGATLISNDLNMRLKAESQGVVCKEYYIEAYTGIYEIKGTAEEINEQFQNLEDKLLPNQYVIITDSEGKETTMRFDGEKFVNLILPDPSVIKGLNAKQRCALDLLMNKNIPIKVIAGGYGSGKTKLSTAIGVYYTFEKNEYDTLYIVRNPVGSGEGIGFLPGDFEEKTANFFKAVEDCMDMEKHSIDYLEKAGKLKKNIPFYMKGLTIQNSFIIVDEAEDLNLKTLKMIGARTGEGSACVFVGDYKQAETKFVNDNGLIQLIERTKGNPLVGVVVLDEDVRSSASKVFANI